MKEMIVTLPVCSADFKNACSLLSRHVLIGAPKIPRLVLLPDDLSPQQLKFIHGLASAASVEFTTANQLKTQFLKTWPVGPNIAFLSAVQAAMTIEADCWLFLEPDCVIVKPDWYQQLFEAYQHARKPFLGTLVPANPPLPKLCMNGVAVYKNPFPDDLVNAIQHDITKPFDVVISTLAPNDIADTPLIQFALAKDRKQVVWYSANQVRKGAVIVHGDKTGALPKILFESEKKFRQKSVNVLNYKPQFGLSGSLVWRGPDVGVDPVFWHSGDLGDIVAFLAILKALGGGHIVLGPWQNREPFKTREQMTTFRANFIKPLLELQPYVKSVEFSDTMPPDAIDVNQFRLLIYGSQFDQHIANRISTWPAELLNVPSWVDSKPWLFVDKVPDTPPVIFCRTARYRDPQFDWPTIVDKYRDIAGFVGTKAEYKDFTREFGDVKYVPITNALDMARLINSAELLVSNQTLALIIAVGLQKPVIVEYCWKSPNNQYNYPGFQYGSKCILPHVIPPPKINWHVVHDYNSGLGRWAFQYAKLLRTPKLYWSPTRKDINHATHPFQTFTPPQSAKRVLLDALPEVAKRVEPGDIVLTIWESDKIPKKVVDSLNKASCVIVPSKFCYDVFTSCGVTVPIHVATLGIDPEVFNPINRPAPSTPLRFGCATRWSDPTLKRKKVQLLVDAFLEAVPSPDTAVLELKGYGESPPQIPEDNRIKLVTKFFTDDQLADWYRSLDFFVNIATGGWELHVHEAMACGAVPIVMYVGGLTEFVDSGCAILVPHVSEKATDLFLKNIGSWYTTTKPNLVQAIKTAIDMPPKKRATMAAAAVANASRLTWQNAADWLEQIIKAYL